MNHFNVGRPLLSSLSILIVSFCATGLVISPALSAPPKDKEEKEPKGWGRGKNKNNAAPTISGTPDGTVLENTFYDFLPNARDRNGDSLTFSIANKPGWADFDPTTGALYGTPTSANVDYYDSISISVSDGQATDSLAAFAIEVTSVAQGSVTLNWTPPTENTDGTQITDLAGYRIYYSTNPQNLDSVIELSNPGMTSYVVENLTPNVWHFAATSYNSGGMESVLSGSATFDTR